MHIRSAVVGTAALVVLLTAGAAQSLSGSNTVASDDIVDGNVTSADIKDQGVLYADIKDGALTGRKILDNSIVGADINEDTLDLPYGSITGQKVQDESLTGYDIDESTLDTSVMLSSIYTFGKSVNVPAGQTIWDYSECDEGRKLINGGTKVDNPLVNTTLELRGSHPDTHEERWIAVWRNPSAQSESFSVYATCARLD